MQTAPPSPESNDARSRNLAGIAFMCAAGLFFALLDTTAKYMSASDIPLAQIVWFRFFGHAILSVLVLGPHRLSALARTTKPVHQWLRSGLMLGATFFNFLAVSYLRLDQTATIFFLTPLVVAALAGPMLGEWIGWRRLLAVLTGFIGIVIVVRPGFGWIHWAVIFSFGAMLCYALFGISTRYLARFDSAEVTQFYTPLVGVIAATPLAFALWVWPADAVTWGLLIWMGACGAFGQWLFIQAAARAPVPVISPFTYVNLIWMTALGYLIFSDVPDLPTLAGGAVVVSSGLYLLYRERRAR